MKSFYVGFISDLSGFIILSQLFIFCLYREEVVDTAVCSGGEKFDVKNWSNKGEKW